MLRRFIATASILLSCFIVLAVQPGQQAPAPGQYPPPQEHPPGQLPPQQQYPIESLKGAALYAAYCASCHGRDGRGNGPTAAALKVAPPDLTTLSLRYGGKFPRDRVEKVILGENQEALAHGSREMPVWGPIFGQIEWDQDLRGVRVRSLSDYLESIQQRKIGP
jgi:mono/diheme cytochrome c family protein